MGISGMWDLVFKLEFTEKWRILDGVERHEILSEDV